MGVRSLALAVVCWLVVVCSVSHATEVQSRIQHVVVLMMENRSFDNLLGFLRTINPEVDGLVGNECNYVNATNPSSKKVCVSRLGFDEGPDDPGHSLKSTTLEIFGYHKPISTKGTPRMDGFVQDAYEAKHHLDMPMAMFTPSGDGAHSASVINTLANEFVVFDRWFASIPGPTDPNRGYAMAGTSNGYTTNFDGKLWTQPSYFDFLGKRNISWNAYYQDDPWAVMYFEDIQKIPANRARVHEWPVFFSKLAAGHLSKFTWLQPRMTAHKGPPTWQHPDSSVSEGERLIQSVYDALKAQPAIWNRTAFIITYDEHGGFYDHVPPPQENIPSPDGKPSPEGFRFDRLGVRIPTVLVSPWVNKHVEHEPPTAHYEHTSVMHTVNNLFGIKEHLTARAAWSGTFDHLFLQRSEPRGLTEIPHLPVMPLTWTHEDTLRQGRKPLNDHLEMQVEFYCRQNGHPVATCNAETFTNQRDASIFIDEQVPIFLAKLEREYPATA